MFNIGRYVEFVYNLQQEFKLSVDNYKLFLACFHCLRNLKNIWALRCQKKCQEDGIKELFSAYDGNLFEKRKKGKERKKHSFFFILHNLPLFEHYLSQLICVFPLLLTIRALMSQLTPPPVGHVCGSHSWLPFVVSIRGPHSWPPLLVRPSGGSSVYIKKLHAMCM